jgi:hypothetical protein
MMLLVDNDVNDADDVNDIDNNIDDANNTKANHN